MKQKKTLLNILFFGVWLYICGALHKNVLWFQPESNVNILEP